MVSAISCPCKNDCVATKKTKSCEGAQNFDKFHTLVVSLLTYLLNKHFANQKFYSYFLNNI